MNQNENVFCANAESSIESGCSTIYHQVQSWKIITHWMLSASREDIQMNGESGLSRRGFLAIPIPLAMSSILTINTHPSDAAGNFTPGGGRTTHFLYRVKSFFIKGHDYKYVAKYHTSSHLITATTSSCWRSCCINVGVPAGAALR
jgi:hypothetical protein